jgi:hypothetical protein
MTSSDDPRDLRDTFVRALQELGVWLPDRGAAEDDLGRELAGDLLSMRISLEDTARHVCQVWELDEAIHHGLSPKLEAFVRMAWLYGGPFYQSNGGDGRLLEAAQAMMRPD